MKLSRVMHIFLGEIKLGGLLVKSWYQVLFTLLIVAGQMVLVVISMIVTYPVANIDIITSMDDVFPILIITCANPHIAILCLLILYDSALVIVINGFAVFTLRVPKNFMETRNIASATVAIGVVWIVFIPLYFTTRSEFQSGVIALAMMCMAVSILICLILPRLYAAFMYRERACKTPNDVESDKSLERLRKLAVCETDIKTVP